MKNVSDSFSRVQFEDFFTANQANRPKKTCLKCHMSMGKINVMLTFF